MSEEEQRYESGKTTQLLDIVSVPLLKATPAGHQVENHTLDDKYYWKKTGVATWKQVLMAADAYDSKFWSASQSTYHGINDKVAAADVAKIGCSLKLVHLPKLQILVRSESGFEDNPARRRVRAQFTIKSESYLLSVTDPEIDDAYLTKGNGTYDFEESVLCISLAEVWNGFAFRVVASVITPERCAAAK